GSREKDWLRRSLPRHRAARRLRITQDAGGAGPPRSNREHDPPKRKKRGPGGPRFHQISRSPASRSIACARIGLHILSGRIAIVTDAVGHPVAGTRGRGGAGDRTGRSANDGTGRRTARPPGQKTAEHAAHDRATNGARTRIRRGWRRVGVGRRGIGCSRRITDVVGVVFGNIARRALEALRIPIPDAANIPPPAVAAVVDLMPPPAGARIAAGPGPPGPPRTAAGPGPPGTRAADGPGVPGPRTAAEPGPGAWAAAGPGPPGVSDLAPAGGLLPFGGGPLWFASSAWAGTANTASSDTNGRTNVDRLVALILEKPLLAVLPAPIGMPLHRNAQSPLP